MLAVLKKNNVLQYSKMLSSLSLWEFKTRYAGTAGGFVWSLILPLTMAMIYWYVFAIGLRSQGPDDMPFILWFMCGFIPWTAFNETVMNNVTSIVKNANLVKNLLFPVEILPMINLIVSQLTHFVFLTILVILLYCYNIGLDMYSLQIIYYFFALLIFSLGISMLLSSLNVYYRDLSLALNVIMNIWFWITPIVWPPNLLSNHAKFILQCNPIYYIVNGYRESFLYHHFFWESPSAFSIFWIINISLFLFGWCTFTRLKRDFVDVL